MLTNARVLPEAAGRQEAEHFAVLTGVDHRRLDITGWASKLRKRSANYISRSRMNSSTEADVILIKPV